MHGHMNGKYANLLYYKECGLVHVSATCYPHLQGGVLEGYITLNVKVNLQI